MIWGNQQAWLQIKPPASATSLGNGLIPCAIQRRHRESKGALGDSEGRMTEWEAFDHFINGEGKLLQRGAFLLKFKQRNHLLYLKKTPPAVCKSNIYHMFQWQTPIIFHPAIISDIYPEGDGDISCADIEGIWSINTNYFRCTDRHPPQNQKLDHIYSYWIARFLSLLSFLISINWIPSLSNTSLRRKDKVQYPLNSSLNVEVEKSEAACCRFPVQEGQLKPD